MSLKVIAGVYGSRVLKTVRGLGTRPLLGQVKAAIFNVLAEHVPDAVVWDLFAGSGANGIEALSRGARRVLFVEKNNRAIDTLRGNLRALGDDAVARSRVVRGDAWAPPALVATRAVESAEDGEDGEDDATPRRDAGLEEFRRPDLIFLDPPYAMVLEDPVKAIYRAQQLVHELAPEGCLVFHFEAGAIDSDDFDDDITADLRQWGSSAIAFLWRAGEAPERVLRQRARSAGA